MSDNKSNNIVDQGGLKKFRATLTAAWILQQLQRFIRLLLRLPIGVGKSAVADKVILDPETYRIYDLVIYVACAWSIITERLHSLQAAALPIEYFVLRARPTRLCGPLNEQWEFLETRGCSSLARETLCSKCPKKDSECTWWPPLEEKIKDRQFILCTDQRLNNAPTILSQIIDILKPKKVLLILDEGGVTKTLKPITISANTIEIFINALRTLPQPEEEYPTFDADKAVWVQNLSTLLRADTRSLRMTGWIFPSGLNQVGLEIQRHGVDEFGHNFENIAHLVSLFQQSKQQDRWKDKYGNINFVVRQNFDRFDILVLAANLPKDFVKKQLQLPDLESPFESLQFRHTDTRIFNLKFRSGAAKYFRSNMHRILDFIAAKIAFNIKSGKSTLLVSQKKFKVACANYLRKTLKQLGFDVSFPTEVTDDLRKPNSNIVPIIHYAVIGINIFTDYDACYCLNSFNLPASALRESTQGNIAECDQIAVDFHYDSRQNRIPTIDHKHRYSDLAKDVSIHHRVLEIDAILQAVGRCRFYTHAREIIFFQMADFTLEVGPVIELPTIERAYQEFGLLRPRITQRLKQIEELRALMFGGFSMRKAARKLNISSSTAARWLKQNSQVSQNPFNTNYSLREIGTVETATTMEEVNQ
ncbi:hypothetical protein WDW37_08060 [Bdellovibrionota bacterium FG-1]